MSYEVDVSGLGIGTLDPGWFWPVSLYWPGEIAPGQWFRLAPQLNQDNSPGTSLQITYEGVHIDGSGTQNADLTVTNNGGATADFTMNVISTPSHF